MHLRNIDCIHVYIALEPTFVFCYFDVVTRHLAGEWSSQSWECERARIERQVRL